MTLVRIIVTFFYIGHVKLVPGSVASVVTVLVFNLSAKYLIFSLLMIIILVTIIFSYFSVRIYTNQFSEKDRSEIVIDEVIGQLIALSPLLLFLENNLSDFRMYLISLLFFRFFDIVKPFPINKFDKMNNSFGIIMDDILAGIFSALLLTLILVF